MSKLLALLTRDLGAGFALAGAEVSVAKDSSVARAALDGAVASRAYGIIIVQEELLQGMGEQARKEFVESTVPLIIEVSGEMVWRMAAEALPDDYVAQLIRRAVGYQLNIKL